MIEALTYSEIGERLGCSPEAARALAKRRGWRRQPGNDGRARVAVDLTEIDHTPTPRTATARSPADHQAVAAALKVRIETLEAELAKAEIIGAGHRADYEHERERADRLVTELARLADLMAEWRRPWWRRLRLAR